ncbi:MAG: VWA domain-containing protein [Proteobacteria bacterium]|nr:VWA domain-containing protein [Pseudomonadota bacterium]
MRVATALSVIGFTVAIGCASGTPDGSQGASCTSYDDCNSELVCTSGGTCEVGASCTGHSECDNGTICGSAGTCVANRPDGPCAVRDNCVGDQTCNSDNTCVDKTCGGELFKATEVPPNVLIVLDRSGSMINPDNNIGGQTRWAIAHDAIDKVLTNFETSIRFGLMVFPYDQQDCTKATRPHDLCHPGAVFEDPQLENQERVTTFLGGTTTCNICTPIAGSLNELLPNMGNPAYPGLSDTSRSNYVLLISDGEQCLSCDGDPAEKVQNLRERSPEIKTFVVGFGEDVRGSDQLNAMAENGGTARPGDTKYYQAESAEDLDAALEAISGAVLSCDYELSKVPPDSNELSVYFNNVQVARSASNGWEYNADNNHVVFSGSVCTELQSGRVTDLKIIFGCPDDIIIVD